LFVIVYVILQYYSGQLALSPFQVKTAWVTVYTMLLDLVIDLRVSVLLAARSSMSAQAASGSACVACAPLRATATV
jgi:hypothetical protein